MGVKGLHKFIESKNWLFELHDISNSLVVIDGLNLANNLSHNFCLDNKTSGDYDQYYSIISQFFDSLKKFNIRCILVIDGSTSDSRFKIIEKRMKKRIKESTSSKLGNVKPLFINRVFINYAKNNGIQLHQSIYDSDYDTALLANLYQCPVLTADSDFYLFNIKKGCFSVSKAGLNTEKVKLYKIDNFMSKFSFKSIEMVIIFGIISDNNEHFTTLINHINLNQPEIKDFKLKLINCLNKFEKKFDFYNYLQELINSKLKINLEQIKCLIEESLTEYLLKKTSDDINNNNPIVKIDECLLNDYRSCAKERCWLDILIHKRLVLPCLIEINEWPSVYLSSVNIRKYFYGKVIEKYQPQNINCSIMEYLRLKDEFKEFKVDVLHGEKFDFLNDLLKKSDYSFIKTLLVSLNYWIKHLPTVQEELTNLKKSNHLNFIKSFIVSLIKCSIASEDNSDIFKELGLEVNLNDIRNLNNTFNNIFKHQKLDYNRNYLHCLSEFQTFYLSLCFVGELDDVDICLLRPEKFYNGKIILHCLEKKAFLNNLFNKKSLQSLKPIYDKILGIYLTMFSEELNEPNFTNLIQTNAKSKRRAKRKDKNSNVCGNINDGK